MAADKSYARLGLFVVVGVVVMLATGLFFIQRMRSRAVISLVTYTTENVSGLDISSPVRYRGVSVGRVSDVRVDSSGRSTIEIDFEIFYDRLTDIGANARLIQRLSDLPVFPRLRSRVVGNPVTGDAYLLLDVPSDPPPPMALGFTPSRPYVASMPSIRSTVENRLPEVLERAQETLQVVREIVMKIPERLDRGDRAFTNIERIIRESQLPQLSADLRAFSTTSSANIAQIASNMDRLVGTDGTLVKFAEEARSALRAADVPASTQLARDAADRTSLAADDLRRSLPVILDSLEQLRELARRLEEQPESVVYGPRKPGGKSR
jgi:paraquat-inducible protein B